MKNKILRIALPILLLVAMVTVWAIASVGESNIIINEDVARISVASDAFEDFGLIPAAYTGHGEDISPPFTLGPIAPDAQSIAILMDDLDIPFIGNYTHWTIWNLPVMERIPEAIPAGETVETLGGAVQGMGYGKHEYRGPKPPFGTHRYQFHIFILDTTLPLDASAGKAELLGAMEGHILQYGSITGWYPRAK